jgi:hypothetical protein
VVIEILVVRTPVNDGPLNGTSSRFDIGSIPPGSNENERE